jgi:hypothetical protein
MTEIQYEPLSDQHLNGRTVILSSEHYFGSEDDRRFRCNGGFGCRPKARGSAVLGEFIAGGSKGMAARVERYEIESVQLANTDG